MQLLMTHDCHLQKNQESKLIILYDLDDKSVAQNAHTLVQRGFDNIYVLSGGLVDFAEAYPDRIEGLPLPKRATDPAKKPAKEFTRATTAMSTHTKSVCSSATKRKEDGHATEVSSVSSSLSVAETVITRANARKAHVATAVGYR